MADTDDTYPGTLVAKLQGELADARRENEILNRQAREATERADGYERDEEDRRDRTVATLEGVIATEWDGNSEEEWVVGYSIDGLYETLSRLHGQRVRITVERLDG